MSQNTIQERDKVSDWSLYGRLLGLARPFWGNVLVLFLLNLFLTPLSLLRPLPLKIAIDSVVGSEPLPGFITYLLPASETFSQRSLLLLAVSLSLGIAVTSKVNSLAIGFLSTFTREKMVLTFRQRLLRHAQKLSLSYHDSRGSADSIHRIQNNTTAIEKIAVDGLFPFVTSILTFFGMLYVSLRIDWELTLIALAAAPVYFTAAHFFKPRLRGLSREVNKLQSSTLRVLQEILGAQRVVKAFQAERREEERYTQHANKRIGTQLRVVLLGSFLGLVTGLATALSVAAVLYVGINHVIAGTLSLGNLLLLRSYLSQLESPLKTIARKYTKLQSYFASAERAFELLDEEPEVAEREDAGGLERAQGAVVFDHVSFSYGSDRPVLSEVSFVVKPWTRVGILGPTGTGKTTLISLLMRLYDPTDGAILIDGIDIREYRLSDVRNQFAVVLQEPVLFSTTIAANIAYGEPDASMHRIVAAAKAANAHEFIDGLPDKYETQVGERGMQLSGGERQRVALARAFLADSPILILDEPTSSVDIQTEASIMQATERLMQGRTVFMIAHRLSTLESCDLILVMRDGGIKLITTDLNEAKIASHGEILDDLQQA